MKRPYIVCHVVTSLDDWIDYTVTSEIEDVGTYYDSLTRLDAPSTPSGKVTDMLEMVGYGEFHVTNARPLGKEDSSKGVSIKGYEIIVNAKGALLWRDDPSCEKPHLIITSEAALTNYLDYLDSKCISWIACGREKINLARAMEILTEGFAVSRLAVISGGYTNGEFLQVGLLDEISLPTGLGVDGREGMASVLDGFFMETGPTAVTLKEVKAYPNGIIWLRYMPEN